MFSVCVSLLIILDMCWFDIIVVWIGCCFGGFLFSIDRFIFLNCVSVNECGIGVVVIISMFGGRCVFLVFSFMC